MTDPAIDRQMTSRSLHIGETSMKQGDGYVAPVDVALIRWPGEEEKRAFLLASRQPHLLLVESGPPPVISSPIEDWIRVPASAVDLEARLESLRRRSRRFEAHQPSPDEAVGPQLEEGGILRFGSGWVSLSPIEARLVATLLEQPGAVTRQALIESGWPQVGQGRQDLRRNALDAHMLRLRQRLPEVGLTVRTIRSRISA